MTQEDIDKTLADLKAVIRDMSDRELLENIYIMLKINTLNAISINNMLSTQCFTNTRTSNISSQ